jgi:hypothetical protein
MRINLKDHNAGQYIERLPDDAHIIGEIIMPGPSGTGALVLLDTWEFVQISKGKQYPLIQKDVHTAIIRATLHDFCKDDRLDLAIELGFSLDTIKSWLSGRRVPCFGIVRLLLINYKIIKLD